MFFISKSLIRLIISLKYQQFTGILNLPQNDDYLKKIEQNTKGLIKEYVDNIFNNKEEQLKFYDMFIQRYSVFFNETLYPKPNEQLKNSFNEVIKAKEFKLMLNNVKKIIIFVEFNDKVMIFPIEEYTKRKIVLKQYIPSKNYIIKEQCQSNYMGIVLLNPPLLKSGFSLTFDIKPIVISIKEKNTVLLKLIDNIILEKEERDSELKPLNEIDMKEKGNSDLNPIITPINLTTFYINNDSIKKKRTNSFNNQDSQDYTTTIDKKSYFDDNFKNYNINELSRSHFNLNLNSNDDEYRRSVIIKKKDNTIYTMNDISTCHLHESFNHSTSNLRKSSGITFFSNNPNSLDIKMPNTSRGGEFAYEHFMINKDNNNKGKQENNYSPVNTHIKAQVCLKNYQILNQSSRSNRNGNGTTNINNCQLNHISYRNKHKNNTNITPSVIKNDKVKLRKMDYNCPKQITQRNSKTAYINYHDAFKQQRDNNTEIISRDKNKDKEHEKQKNNTIIGRSVSKTQIKVPTGNILFNNYNFNISEISKKKEKSKTEILNTGNSYNNKNTYVFNNHNEAIQFISSFKKKNVIIKIKPTKKHIKIYSNESMQTNIMNNNISTEDNIIITETDGNYSPNSTNNLKLNQKKSNAMKCDNNNNQAIIKKRNIDLVPFSNTINPNISNNNKLKKLQNKNTGSIIKLAKIKSSLSNKNMNQSIDTHKKQKYIQENNHTNNKNINNDKYININNINNNNCINCFFSNEKK